MSEVSRDDTESSTNGGRNDIEDIRHAHSDWVRQASQLPERKKQFVTASSEEIEPLYLPAHIEEYQYLRDLGMPGEYPFTRGVYSNMYRGRLWTMRMFAGFGTAEDTNQRFKYLLEHGQTGLSTTRIIPSARAKSAGAGLQ
jgi:methylmalonyl-CoA mutase N-terminal domain/subunit